MPRATASSGTSMLPVGGAFSAAETTATAARTPRLSSSSGAGPAGGGVLLAWLDVSGLPGDAQSGMDAHGHHEQQDLDAAADWPDDSREPRAHSLDRCLGDRHRDDRHGRRAALRRPAFLERPGGRDAVDGSERAHGAGGAGRLAGDRHGRAGRAGAVGRGQRHRGLGDRPRASARRGAGQAEEDRHRGVRALLPCVRATPGRRSSTSRGATATARASTARACGMPTRARAPSTSRCSCSDAAGNAAQRTFVVAASPHRPRRLGRGHALRGLTRRRSPACPRTRA